METIHPTLNAYAQNAFSAVLVDKDIEPLSPTEADEQLQHWPDVIYCCVLGFSSPEMAGSLVLCCEREFIENVLSDAQPSEEAVCDWLGELGNLVAGRIKASMLAHDVNLVLNPPSVTQASPEILNQYASRNPTGPFWYDLDGHSICLQLGADTVGVDFSNIIEADSLSPGRAVLAMNPVGKKPQESEATPVPPSDQELASFEVGQRALVLTFANGLKIQIPLQKLEQAKSLNVGPATIEAEPSGAGVRVKSGDYEIFWPKSSA